MKAQKSIRLRFAAVNYAGQEGAKAQSEFWFSPRIMRSPRAVPYWKDKTGADIERCLENHPEEWLKRFAAEGYNGVLLNAILRTLLPSRLFPDVKRDKLDRLNRLVERAGKYGVKVYLILHEPRGLLVNDPFWEKHPDLRGQPFAFKGISADLDNAYYALCSSTSEVREYLEGGAYELFRRVQGLGGLSLITASEYHTHCYAHYPLAQKKFTEPDMAAWARAKFVCPRCIKRSPAAVVAEIISLVARGARRADPQAEIMARTWSWYIVDPDPQKKLIGMLPKGIALLADWERGSKKLVLGRRYPVDEYSYSIVGPAPKFVRQVRIVKENSLKMFAKISINATHELRSIPYLPVPYILAQKMERMRALGVKGFEGSSPFGAEMTPMTRLASIMSRVHQPPPEDAVRELAEMEFGADNAEEACRAWKFFGLAWKNYPFSMPLLYWGPINYATVWPFARRLKKTERIAGWLPLPRDKAGHLITGDNLETWIKPFSPAVVIKSFELVLTEWRQGVEILADHAKRVASLCNDNTNRTSRALLLEKQLAEHILLSLKSTINIVKYCLLYRRWKALDNPIRKQEIGRQLASIAADEMRTAFRDIELVKSDPRLGYHPEAQERLFTIDDLKFKVRQCREAMRRQEYENQ